MVFVSLYLYEELTHIGDRHRVDRTLATVQQGTIRGVFLCAVVAAIISVSEFIVMQKVCRRLKFHRPTIISAVVALLCWLTLFVPAAVHAYSFYVSAE